MKKIISLALVLFMMIPITGCLFKESDDDYTNKTNITRGEISQQIYTNEVMDFKFNAPSMWVYSTDEEIALALDIAKDNFFSDKKFEAALNDNISIYDMLVVDKISNSNVIVGYENLKISLSSNITEEQYIEAVKKQFGEVSGIKVTFSEKTEKVKLGQTDFTKMVCKTTTNGVTVTQAYYVHKIGKYMGFVIITAYGNYSITDIEEMFE